jgi:hypothetical protein
MVPCGSGRAQTTSASHHHHDAGDGVLLLLGHGLVDDDERTGAGLALGHQIVRLAAEIERVDLVVRH